MKKIILKSIDNYSLELNIYEVKNPKAIIKIIHGMEEHQDRYKELAKYLNNNNYTVITSNLRGHGNTKIQGYFSDKDGDKLLIKDEEIILNYIKENYKENIYLYAHSFGTIIARNLLQNNSKSYKKVILTGYPNNKFGVRLGILIANLQLIIKKPTSNSKLLHVIAIDSFNNKIKNPKTNLDWLSYNEENINNYINDSLCGNKFKLSALRDLFVLVNKMNNKKLFKNINKNIKILLLRGEDDPCTGFNKGSSNSINALRKIGFNNIKEIVYKNMRHEIINEKDNKRVYEDIVKFYDL